MNYCLFFAFILLYFPTHERDWTEWILEWERKGEVAAAAAAVVVSVGEVGLANILPVSENSCALS